MAQEVQSFWTDIKKYEDILLNDPNSFCFAQLSELYRKLGLLDDAIFVAKRGVEMHPDYVGGHLALGKAYFDKGLKPDSREALERVVRSTPENYSAQKLLSQLYLELNDVDLAKKTLQRVLELNPEDVESRLSLEALSRCGETDSHGETEYEDEEDLEEAEIVEDDLPSFDDWQEEILVEPTAEVKEPEPLVLEETEPSREPLVLEGTEPSRDPLTTATLAEIYLSQGFHDQALRIFRELADAAPDNDELRRRIAEIERLKTDTLTTPASPDSSTVEAPLETFRGEPSPSATFTVTAEDRSVADLEKWLLSIERRRACR